MSDPGGLERDRLDYAAFYCEENVWRLLSQDWLPKDDAFAVFVSNPDKTCAVWAQRAAPAPGTPAVWDYHVIAVAAGFVYDLDTTLAFPSPVEAYLQGTFPLGEAVPDQFAPRFRVVPAAEFAARFSSDRSHMLDGDGYRAPPPPWPAIQPPGERPSNLDAFVDTESEFVGACYDLAGFRGWLRGGA